MLPFDLKHTTSKQFYMEGVLLGPACVAMCLFKALLCVKDLKDTGKQFTWQESY